MTTVIIKDDCPQGKQLLEYIKTLPYASVVENNTTKPKSVWEEAIAEGAVSPKEFHEKLKNEITNNW